MFRLLDMNHSGLIEFKEFLQVLSTSSRGRFEEKAELAFRFYDFDGDGKISKMDMHIVMESIYRM